MRRRKQDHQPLRIGKVIRRWRLMEERTLREVGKEMGISAATLLRIEQGEACDSGTLALLLTWLLAPETRP